MSDTKSQVDGDLQDFYDSYYLDSGLVARRSLVSRVLAGSLFELSGRKQFESILDVGAGEGSFLQLMNDTGVSEVLHGVEISESGVAAIKARQIRHLKSVSRFDGYALNFPEQSQELLTALHVLEHVEHERLFLQELARVGKYAFIEVPLENTINIKKAISQAHIGGHINYYNEDTFRALLETSGFSVLGIKTYAYPLAYEQMISGKTKGLVKSTIRTGALRLLPGLAKRQFVYLSAAFVKSKRCE
jgi:2-polyprenyl-3-methyl-5-hydroxy-6-metoxy-1,4-benzoquinol methylase